jgi:hypothetical protein
MNFRPEVVHFIFKIYICRRLGIMEILINSTQLEVREVLVKVLVIPWQKISNFAWRIAQNLRTCRQKCHFFKTEIAYKGAVGNSQS